MYTGTVIRVTLTKLRNIETESRYKGEGSPRQRVTIVIFPEHIEEFLKAINEVGGKLTKIE